MEPLKIVDYILSFEFFCLCGGSLFLISSAFVNEHITPKWYCAIFCASVLLLTILFRSKKYMSTEKLLSVFCILIGVLISLQAVFGILQFVGVFTGGDVFRVTGSFDNPAGFSACLCAGFPFLFYYRTKKYTWQRWIFLLAIIVTTIAVALSASRAGIMSLIVVSLFVLFSRIQIQVKKKMIVGVVAVVIVLSGLYLLKKDSADGRLLIWRCSWEMIKDKPLLGHGHGGFKANYMNYQADYFEKYPDSRYAMLADNVNSPFNEYLLLLVDYGFVGFILFFVICWFLWKSFLLCKQEHEARLAAGCLLSIAVFSLFSYPLRYPFVWIIGMISIFIILYKSKRIARFDKFIIRGKRSYFFGLILVILLGICQLTWKRMSAEMEWCHIAHQSLWGKTKQMLSQYNHLHKSLTNNELFLYNYAAELNVATDYAKSLQIARECERLLADYDLQMLIADNCQELQRYTEAEDHYRKAAAMCPVKFVPLYKLAKLYEGRGDKSQAQAIAEVVLTKKVKILSPTIVTIQKEMRQLMERDKNDPETPCRANDKPFTIQPRQEKVSEARSTGALLPP